MSNQDPVSYLTRALAICEEQLGARHPSTRTIYENYITLLQTLGRDAKRGRWKRFLGLFGR